MYNYYVYNDSFVKDATKYKFMTRAVTPWSSKCELEGKTRLNVLDVIENGMENSNNSL